MGRGWYYLCSCHPTVELAVGLMKKIFCVFLNNLTFSLLTTAQAPPLYSNFFA